MCFNIIFRKRPFPESDVGNNKEMRRLGIRCMKEVDDELFSSPGKEGKKASLDCSGEYTPDCKGCSLYKLESRK